MEKQKKIIDTGVFVEYKDIKEIKTFDGIPLNYHNSFGNVTCGECHFNITQQDTITTRIDVSDIIGC